MEQSDLDKIVRECRQNDNVKALWLFGSESTDDVTPMSDVDFAILAEESLSATERFELRKKIVQILARDDVDLVPLSDANPVLCYEAVTDGKRLFARDEDFVDRFEQRCLMKYFDTAHLRDLKYRLRREKTE